MSTRTYTFNTNIFEEIDSEEKAYWLGFLLGDGGVRNNHLRLKIHIQDLSHVIKFKNFISATQPIKSKPKEAIIYLCNKDFVQKISKWSLIPNKTNHIFTPDISSLLLSHFYRGLIDADGWITESYPYNHSLGFCSGNSRIVLEMKAWFESSLNLESFGYFFHRQRTTGSSYQFNTGGNFNYVKAYKLIYQNCSIALDRKLKKATKLYESITSKRILV